MKKPNLAQMAEASQKKVYTPAVPQIQKPMGKPNLAEMSRQSQSVRAPGAIPALPVTGHPWATGNLPTITDRAKNVLTGTAKQSVSGYGNALATLYDAGQGIRDQQNKDYLSVYSDRLRRAQKDLQMMLDDNKKTPGTWTPADIQSQRNIIEDETRKAGAMKTAIHAQPQATRQAEEAMDTLAESGGRDIEEAKRGWGKVGRFGVDVAAAGLGMLGDAAVSAALLGVPARADGTKAPLYRRWMEANALPTMAARGFGGGAQEARQGGGDLKDQLLYGAGSAAVSVATEKLSNLAKPFSKMFGGGAADDLVDAAIGKAVSRAAKTAAGATALDGLLRTGASFAGEGVEEFLEDVASPILKRLTYDPQARFDLEEAAYDFLVGGALGGLGGAVDVATETKGRNREYQNAMLTQLKMPKLEQKKPAAPDTLPTPVAPKVPTAEENVNGLSAQLAEIESGKRVRQEEISQQDFDELANRNDMAMDARMNVYKVDPTQHIDNRGQRQIASRKINAFQFDHPELRDYYIPAAEELLVELSGAQRGGETHTATGEYGQTYAFRTKRQASPRIEALLDGGMTYSRIESALDAIIKDHGAENYADGKRVEMVLDDMLSNGYNDGRRFVPANEQYIGEKNNIPGNRGAEYGHGLDDVDPMEAMPNKVEQGFAQGTDRTVGTKPAKLRMPTLAKNAGLEQDSYVRETMDRRTARDLDTVAKALGVNVRFVDEVRGGTANAQIEGAEVLVERGNPNPVKKLLGHEWTHRMQELAPEEYNAFRDYVETKVQDQVEDYRKRYGEQGVDLDYEGALDEATADYAGEMIQNGNVLDEFIRENRDNRTLLEKALDAIRELARKLTGKEKQQADEAERKLLAALNASAENVEGIRNAEQATARESRMVDNRETAEDFDPLAAPGDMEEFTARYSAKFSMKEPVEETKDLLALHNLTERNLEDALNLGGLPMPSIAIVKAKAGHSKYGPISLVFSKDTIDPQRQKANKVYGGDGYTPTAPTVDRVVDADVRNALEKSIKEKAAKIAGGMFGGDISGHLRFDHGYTSENMDSILESLANTDAARAAYLADHGGTLEPVMTVKAENFDSFGNAPLDDYVKKIGEEDLIDRLYDKTNDKGLMDYAVDATDEDVEVVREILKNYWRRKKTPFGSTMSEETVNKRAAKLDKFRTGKFIKNAWNYYVSGNLGKAEPVVDSYATSDKLRNMVDTEDVKKWLNPQMNGLLGEAGIYSGTDLFTARGNRRSFKATHTPYTLENIVRAMKKQPARGGQTWGASASALQSVTVPDYKSVKDIKEDSGRLGAVDSDEYRDKIERLNEKIDGIVSEIARNNEPVSSNSFENLDIIGTTLMEAASGNKTASSIIRAFKDAFYNIDESMAHRIQSLFAEAAQLPTEYFEAKPERAVKFDEALAAVVPDDIDNDLKKRLTEAGTNVVEYKTGDDADRLKKVNGVEGARFSLKDSTGAELTEEQAEYFKDSKVRDKEGRLLKVYHGTSEKFTVFDKKTWGSKHDNLYDGEDIGFYFTPYYDDARGYARNAEAYGSGEARVESVYLNMKKPLIVEDDGWGSAAGQADLRRKDIARWLKNGDYDGVIVRSTDYEMDDGEPDSIYIVLDPEQIKSVDNQKPTSDPDIRFSMKDAKDGKPFTATLYHGSGKTAGQIYAGVQYPVAGKGMYYAPTEKLAKEYGDKVETAEVTLKKPMVIRDDEEWRKLTKAAGWAYANPTHQSKEDTIKAAEALKSYIRSRGYDGLIIQYDDAHDGDINRLTRNSVRTLDRVFGHDQVVVYESAPKMPKVKGPTKKTEPVRMPTVAKPAAKPQGKPITKENDEDGYWESLAQASDEFLDPVTPADIVYNAKMSDLQKQEAPPEKEKTSRVDKRDMDELVQLYQDIASPVETASSARQKESENLVSTATKILEKPKDQQIEEAKSYIMRKMVDAGHSVSKMGKRVHDEYLYPFYNAARASASAGINMIKREQTDITGKAVGESLNSIFQPIRAKGDDYYRAFQVYMLDLHNADRMSLSNGDNTAKIEAKEALKKFKTENPDLAELTEAQLERKANSFNNKDQTESDLAKEMLRLTRNVNKLDRMGNKPVFGYEFSAADSKERAARLLREHPEFKGLEERVRAYIDNMMQYRVDSGLMTQKDAEFLKKYYPHYVPTFRKTEPEPSTRDRRHVKVGKTVGRATGGNQKIMPLHEALGKQTMMVTREGSKNRFGIRLMDDFVASGKEAKDVLKLDEYDGDFNPESFDYVPDLKKENTFVVHKGGKRYELTVDVAMFDAVKALYPDGKESNWVINMIRTSNNLFKGLVTGMNPMFMVRNFARDLQAAGLYTRDEKAFLKNYPEAIKQIKNNGEYWRQYQALGGDFSSIFNYETGTVKEDPTSPAGKLLAKIEAANMLIEQAPRMAEFMSVVKAGDGSMENLMDAMHAAADVTTNFGRSGTLGKALNANFVPFLNPSIQGFSRLVRRVTQTKGAKEWRKLVTRAIVLGVAPAVVNAMLYAGEPDWDDLRDSDKDTNYLFRIGKGLWIKVPVGRELSLIRTATNRTLDVLDGRKPDLKGSVKTMLTQTAPGNPFRQNILSAWIDTDLFDPKSPGKTWYGGRIENQRLQGYRPSKRYDGSTDVFSKAIGRVLGLSPKKINYLLDQYTGVVGDFVLPLMTPQAERDPFSKAFTVDSIRNNRITDEFYDMTDEITYDKNDGDLDAAVTARFWDKQKKACADINAKIREIETSDLSNGEKKQQTREAKAVLNGIMKNALDVLPKYQKSVKKHRHGDSDEALDRAYREANKEVFGAEYALEMHNKDTYEKAKDARENGVSYDTFYKYYFDTHDYEKTDDKSVNTQKMEYLMQANIPDREKAEIYFADLASDTDLWKQPELEIKAGITPVEYFRFKVATAGMRLKDEKLEAVDGLNISAAKKTAFYAAMNYKKSTLDEAPWVQRGEGGLHLPELSKGGKKTVSKPAQKPRLQMPRRY